jgi:hypothetical protein
MGQLTLILILFASLIVIFGFGSLMGHLFGLDKYLDDLENKDKK